MDVDKEIAERILTRMGTQRRFVAAVCGAADLGKSFLSDAISGQLNRLGVPAGLLPMDSFLTDRESRVEQNLSGYQPEACNLKEVERLVGLFKQGNDIAYSPYDHTTGKTQSPALEISGARVLIVEGLHSMHGALVSYIGMSLFIHTTDERLRKIRREADIVKRRQSVAYSRAVEPVEFRHYKQQVAPYRDKADLCLFLEKRWQYRLER
ncbi:MAG: hypothetical protein MI802_18700 [Desulfobacterales bacterium]|nr:hypothetical protein [Desulfobacterales bacterium]